MVSPELLLFCFPSRFYIPVIHRLQQLDTFSFSFVFWRVMGSSSCALMDVYMDLVLLPILNSLLLVCWPGRLFLVANFGRIRFSPPAVSAGTGRGAISSQVRGRWQRHMAVNSRIECLDDDSRCPSLECLGCYGGASLSTSARLFRVTVWSTAHLLRSIDSPTNGQKQWRRFFF